MTGEERKVRSGRKAVGGGLYGGSWDSKSWMNVSLSRKKLSKHMINGTRWKLQFS